MFFFVDFPEVENGITIDSKQEFENDSRSRSELEHESGVSTRMTGTNV